MTSCNVSNGTDQYHEVMKPVKLIYGKKL